ncbi:hypothetical protein EII25_01360 [Erysipelotrichaceae bacterium OH741_COT-311]|nr:hypothetical protein EII25_01360 [Erysipelotrichaceae bacterium OH741_COT-311]
MLHAKMNLKEMIDYRLSEEELNKLDPSIMSLSRIVISGSTREECYAFIRYMFSMQQEDILTQFFHEPLETIFYDFAIQEKVIVIFQLLGLNPQHEISTYFEQLLNKYQGDQEIVIDTFDDDTNMYRTSTYDEEIKTTLIPLQRQN